MNGFSSLAPAERQRCLSIVHAYGDAFEVLDRTDDFSPNNPDINRVLSRLVGLVSLPLTDKGTHAVLAHPYVATHQKRMWSYLSRAEGTMEIHFAAILTQETYRDFMYFENYDMLVDAELEQLPECRKECCDGRAVAFVGAGALPLTAVLMHQKSGKQVTCLDSDPEAVRKGREFLMRCGLSAGMTYKHEAGETYDYSAYSTIFIASLVPDKDAVMRRIMECTAHDHHKTIAVRSVEGIHALLYQPVDETEANNLNLYFNRRSATSPEIINTTLFAEMPAKANHNEVPVVRTYAERSEELAVTTPVS